METPSVVTVGKHHTSFSANRASIRGILLLLICGISVVGGLMLSSSHHAFCLPSLVLISSSRNRPSSRMSIFSPLSMARPGQSEEQAKQERENEIRSKIASLKRAGKFTKNNPEESMMLEAEEFFNRESPIRKFERRKKEREQREQEQEQQGEDTQDNDSTSANTTTN